MVTSQDTEEYAARARQMAALFGQTEKWAGQDGWADIDTMTRQRKHDLVQWINRHAVRFARRLIFHETFGPAYAPRPPVTPCATGPGENDVCSAAATGNVWEHGVFHGDVYPGSEIESMLHQEWEDRYRLAHRDPVAYLATTPLMKRLIEDVRRG